MRREKGTTKGSGFFASFFFFAAAIYVGRAHVLCYFLIIRLRTGFIMSTALDNYGVHMWFNFKLPSGISSGFCFAAGTKR